MKIIERGADNFYHPKNEEEICQLIQYANQHHLQVRVRGSAHSSYPEAIYTDSYQIQRYIMIDMMLDQLNRVTFNDEHMQVTVQAGCHLGLDPFDHTKQSTEQNGLCWQLAQRGWALPLLAGITHQTVGGFFSMGSEGGSLQHSLYQHIVGLTIIDGTGKIHQVSANQQPEVFYAAGVSMGLLGIITSLTLQCVKNYYIIGSIENKCLTRPEDFFNFPWINWLRDVEYSRIMWCGLPGIERLGIWQARRMVEADYQPAMRQASGEFITNPAEDLPRVLGSSIPPQLVIHYALKFIDSLASKRLVKNGQMIWEKSANRKLTKRK